MSDTDLNPNPTSNGDTQQADPMQERVRTLVEQNEKQQVLIADMANKYASLAAQQIAQGQNQQAPQPVSQDPLAGLIPDDVDPQTKKMMESFATTLMTRVQTQLAPIQGRLAGNAVEQYAAQAGFSDPAIVARARVISEHWSKVKGLDITPQDALDFATGEAMRQGASGTAGVRNVRAAQTPPPAYGTGGTPGNPPPSNQAALPPNFDNLDYLQQYEILAKKVGDSPI